MVWLQCPYLGHEVELTPERERHIRRHHPGLLPEHRQRLSSTVGDPDQVRMRDTAPDELIFVRRFDDLAESSHIVVVIVTGPADDASGRRRDWIVTAYRTPEPEYLGVAIWERN